MSGKKFGALLRREREAKEIGLREMAKMIGVSPTYLSKVERGDFPPPAEDRVKQIARVIDYDADALLALAGRISSDITETFSRPRISPGWHLRRRGPRASKRVTPTDLRCRRGR
jgi:transcriptional regulator with XRE-family HTH domain